MFNDFGGAVARHAHGPREAFEAGRASLSPGVVEVFEGILDIHALTQGAGLLQARKQTPTRPQAQDRQAEAEQAERERGGWGAPRPGCRQM